MYQLIAKDSEIEAYSLCLNDILKEFRVDITWRIGRYGYVEDFSFDYDSIDVDDILDVHKHLMKKHDVK